MQQGCCARTCQTRACLSPEQAPSSSAPPTITPSQTTFPPLALPWATLNEVITRFATVKETGPAYVKLTACHPFINLARRLSRAPTSLTCTELPLSRINALVNISDHSLVSWSNLVSSWLLLSLSTCACPSATSDARSSTSARSPTLRLKVHRGWVSSGTTQAEASMMGDTRVCGTSIARESLSPFTSLPLLDLP